MVVGFTTTYAPLKL